MENYSSVLFDRALSTRRNVVVLAEALRCVAFMTEYHATVWSLPRHKAFALVSLSTRWRQFFNNFYHIMNGKNIFFPSLWKMLFHFGKFITYQLLFFFLGRAESLFLSVAWIQNQYHDLINFFFCLCACVRLSRDIFTMTDLEERLLTSERANEWKKESYLSAFHGFGPSK